jgi:hypothetical protein
MSNEEFDFNAERKKLSEAYKKGLVSKEESRRSLEVLLDENAKITGGVSQLKLIIRAVFLGFVGFVTGVYLIFSGVVILMGGEGLGDAAMALFYPFVYFSIITLPILLIHRFSTKKEPNLLKKLNDLRLILDKTALFFFIATAVLKFTPILFLIGQAELLDSLGGMVQLSLMGMSLSLIVSIIIFIKKTKQP